MSSFRTALLTCLLIIGVVCPLFGETDPGIAPLITKDAVNRPVVSSPTSSRDLARGTGPVQHNQKVYTIFWSSGGFGFPANYQSTINQFVQDLNGSAYYGIASQYYDSTSYISNQLIFGGTWLDNSSPGAANVPPSSQDIDAEVSRAKAANGWTSDANTYFQVYTPQGYTSTSFCGWHTYTPTNGAIGNILFPFIFQQADGTTAGCYFGNGTYPHSVAIDNAIKVTAHEIMETLTDPQLGNWRSLNNKDEIGDICNFDMGTIAADGSNLTLNGRKYFVQTEWSNAISACTMGALKPTLSITKTHSGNFAQGQQNAQYTLTVSNDVNAATTFGTVLVAETKPPGLVLVSMAGTGWSCVTDACTRTDSLAAGSRYPPITVTVNVAANATSPQINTAMVTGGGSANATVTDPTTIVQFVSPTLSITKTHTGDFTQGQQNAAYTATVSNAANASPTSETVTVTETLPAGLTLASMSGTGWICSSNVCTRSDALAGGSSYPVITVRVNVATNAASALVNSISVSGGGSATASGTNTTTILSNAPTLALVTPSASLQGTAISVSLTGTNFASGMTIAAGTGVTVTNVSVANTTSATATFTIASSATLGTHNVTVTTAFGTSNAATFTVNLPPTLSGISPNSGTQGGTITVTLTGTNFAAGMTVSVGTGVTVSNVVVSGTTSASATFAIANSATSGTRNVSVNAGGTSNTQTFNVLAPTTISLGQTISGILSNTDMQSPLRAGSYTDLYTFTLSSSSTVTISMSSNSVDSFLYLMNTSGTVLLQDDDGAGADNPDSKMTVIASAGTYIVSATTYLPGATGSYTISLAANGPTITDISPAFGLRGTSVNVTLTGTGFVFPMGLTPGAGITLSNFSVLSSTSATATFTIASNAGIGSRDVLLTANSGTATGTFTVNQAPTLTSLSPSSGVQGGALTVGLTGTNFASGMTVAAGAGITVDAVAVSSSTSATATFTMTKDAVLGAHNVTVSAGATSNAQTFTVLAPTTLSTGQTRAGSLSSSDMLSPVWFGSFTRLYKFTLNSTTDTSIAMSSSQFDTLLILFSNTGVVLNSDDDGGGGTNSKMVTTLGPGTYIVEATSYESNATGSFTIGVNGNGPLGLTDLNGDGKSDILWYNPATGQTAVWLMNGTGTTGSATLLTSPLWKITATGDFNGDGKSDLIWNNSATGETAMWLMNGSSIVASATLLTDTNWKVSASADFNGDGKSDLLWYNSATGQTAAWLMNGTTQTSGATLLTDPNWKVTATADFNGDGMSDILWYNAATGQTAAWLMNGTSQASGANLLTDPNWKVTTTADLNGDGKADLLWYNPANGATAAWLMNGTSVSGSASLLVDPNWKVNTTADLNGDGMADILWYNAATGTTAAWLMNGGTQLSGTNLLTDPNWKAVTTGDLDGDGKSDILWYNAATGQTAAWLMNGLTQASGANLLTDSNWKLTSIPTAVPKPTAYADFNGDGKPDLVWYKASAGQTSIWLMNGTTQASSSTLLTDVNWKINSTADFNGDGKSDVLWFNSATGQTVVWLMNGTTQSGSATLLNDPNWKVTATSDFNGDGKADLLWYNAATGQTSMWLMNGASQSSSAVLLTDPNLKVTATADFNGDGKSDLIWYNSATGQTSLWLMNGTTQSSGVTLLTDLNWKITATPDLNGDGKSDILWYNAATGQTAAWLMNGASILASANLLTDPNWKVTSTPDLNGDGKSDIIWYNAATGQTAAWLMNGTTQASGATLLTDPNWKIIATPDLNGDGKSDIIWYNTATGQTSTWLMNGTAISGSIALLTDTSLKVLNTSAPALSIVSGPTLPQGTLGTSYSQTLAATGAVAPYSNWVKTSGNFPTGLSLNASTGTLSGTPTGATGTFSFTISVQDTLGSTAATAFQLVIK